MLATRIVSAIVMFLVAGAALWLLPPRGWAIFCWVVLTIGAWEWGAFARLRFGARVVATAVMAIIYVAAGLWTGVIDAASIPHRALIFYGAATGFWLIAVPWWLARNPPSPPRALVLACGLVALVPAYLAVVHLRAYGVAAFLMVGGIVWIADIAAYFSGRAFGRRKLAPTISPGKTWEGVYGALVMVGGYALLMAGVFIQALSGARPSIPYFALIVGAIALAGVSVMGDLFESALKRQAGLKDSGKVLPGHGGVLDRIDAMIAVLPLAMFGLLLMTPRG